MKKQEKINCLEHDIHFLTKSIESKKMMFWWQGDYIGRWTAKEMVQELQQELNKINKLCKK